LHLILNCHTLDQSKLRCKDAIFKEAKPREKLHACGVGFSLPFSRNTGWSVLILADAYEYKQHSFYTMKPPGREVTFYRNIFL